MNITGISTCENKRVIAVGRLEWEKGYERLLEAWKPISLKHPDWRLDIYGDGSATFNNVTITGGSNTISSSDKSGISINLGQAFSAAAATGAKINEGLINCSQVMANESRTLNQHIGDIAVDRLTAN